MSRRVAEEVPCWMRMSWSGCCAQENATFDVSKSKLMGGSGMVGLSVKLRMHASGSRMLSSINTDTTGFSDLMDFYSSEIVYEHHRY